MIAFNESRNIELSSKIEVARTRREKNQGLLKHQKLNKGEGMWLVPCGSVHTLFMNFPIDVVYLSKDMKVLKVIHSMWPWNISFAPFSTYSVLELPMGACKDSKTDAGDRISIK